MDCIHSIRQGLILPDLVATNRREVLQELAAAVCREYPFLDPNRIFELVYERELLGSTGISEGVAIPHAKIRGLSEISICFGRSPDGIAFDALDGKPTFLFFLLLAPEEASDVYLSCLAELARFLRSAPTRGRLLQAADRETLLAILSGGD